MPDKNRDSKSASSAALRRIQKDWDALGREDPLWAILTDESRRCGKWDLEEFFATGREEIQRALDHVAALGVTLKCERALDFGCGVGRLTRALAAHFTAVDGVDAAPSMIEQARALGRDIGECHYLLNEADNLQILPSEHYDFIYSAITLQHLAPALIESYLGELARVLAPGGVLLFQLPSEPVRGSALRHRIKALLPAPMMRWLNTLRHGARGRMEMHGLRREVVERLLAGAGCRMIDVQPDRSAGESWVSFRYCAMK